MEQNKYFTPDIEDIRIGYECEQLIDYITHTEWVKEVFGKGNWLPDSDVGGIIHWYDTCIRAGRIRTPYLTKEQIEAKGWENIKAIDDDGAFEADKHTHGFVYRMCWTTDKMLQIWEDGENYKDRLYLGECKDINTFRWICKLLVI